MKKGLVTAGTIILIGGGPEDVPADAVAGVVVVGVATYVGIRAAYRWITGSGDSESEGYVEPGTPTASYPGNDAAQPPGEGWQWRGKPGSQPGSSDGNWYNPNTGESLHPDLDHPDPIGPHWDWKSPDGDWYRWYPNGTIEPK